MGGFALGSYPYHTRSSDYRDIDPRYGTLGDWDKLLQGVHQRGMKLMYVNSPLLVDVSHRDSKLIAIHSLAWRLHRMDLVVNHTSDEVHPFAPFVSRNGQLTVLFGRD